MIKVLNPGLYSTIQDKGRFGFQDLGVPYSGVMDEYSASVANVLLGNDEDDAVLEMTMMGGRYEFQCSTILCLSGAYMDAKLNKTAILNNTLIKVRATDILSFGKLQSGYRTYLAVKGGFQMPRSLGSRSFYQPITERGKLEKGDVLSISPFNQSISAKHASLKIVEHHLVQLKIDVFKGPEFDLLSREQQKQLIGTEFSVSKYNNRMAYQLEELLQNDLKAIITSSVLPGTVQLTPSGKLIVLMRDCQTTGGYPRVLQLKDSAIYVLAQKMFKQKIIFNLMPY